MPTDEQMIGNLLVPHYCNTEMQDFDLTRSGVDSGLKNLLGEVGKSLAIRMSGIAFFIL